MRKIISLTVYYKVQLILLLLQLSIPFCFTEKNNNHCINISRILNELKQTFSFESIIIVSFCFSFKKKRYNTRILKKIDMDTKMTIRQYSVYLFNWLLCVCVYICLFISLVGFLLINHSSDYIYIYDWVHSRAL